MLYRATSDLHRAPNAFGVDDEADRRRLLGAEEERHTTTLEVVRVCPATGTAIPLYNGGE